MEKEKTLAEWVQVLIPWYRGIIHKLDSQWRSPEPMQISQTKSIMENASEILGWIFSTCDRFLLYER